MALRKRKNTVEYVIIDSLIEGNFNQALREAYGQTGKEKEKEIRLCRNDGRYMERESEDSRIQVPRSILFHNLNF